MTELERQIIDKYESGLSTNLIIPFVVNQTRNSKLKKDRIGKTAARNMVQQVIYNYLISQKEGENEIHS